MKKHTFEKNSVRILILDPFPPPNKVTLIGCMFTPGYKISMTYMEAFVRVIFDDIDEAFQLSRMLLERDVHAWRGAKGVPSREKKKAPRKKGTRRKA